MDCHIRLGDSQLKSDDFRRTDLDIERHLRAVDQIRHPLYWHRLWIVQEVLLGHNLSVRLGSRTMRREHFEHALEQLTAYRHTVHHDYRSASDADIQTASGLWDIPGNIKLSGITELAQRKDCADIRDKSFGMLGLVKEELRLRPDYTIHSIHRIFCFRYCG